MQNIKQLIKRRWFQGIVVGVVCFLLGCAFSYWLVYHSFDLQEQRDLEQMKLLEPNVSIEISEINENQLKVIIGSINKESGIIDSLSFSFEVGGIFQDISDEFGYTTGGCEITSRSVARMSAQSEVGEWFMKTIKETIYFDCSSINPGEYYTVKLNYLPTEIDYYTVGGSNLVAGRMPVMNLPDYSSYRFSWMFNGIKQIRYGCVNLSSLEYIKKDNENAIDPYSCIIWSNNTDCVVSPEPQEVENARRRHSCHKNMSCHLDYEEYRRRRIC